MKKLTSALLVIAGLTVFMDIPLPNPACAVPFPYHCDPPPKR
jgi:hypothetical protein